MASEQFERFLERVTSTRRWKQKGREAPHKPLVLLYALGSVLASKRWISFRDTEEIISPVVRRHWNSVARIEQPFVRLATDGFWTVSPGLSDVSTKSGAISAALLRKADAHAGFDEETYAMLAAQPLRVTWATRVVLFEIASSDVQTSILETLRLPL